MNPFEMVAIIVIVSVIAGTISSVLRERYRQAAAAPAQRPDADAERLRDEVLRLRERVQVLERVITDQHQSGDLGAEIERLRDR